MNGQRDIKNARRSLNYTGSWPGYGQVYVDCPLDRKAISFRLASHTLLLIL